MTFHTDFDISRNRSWFSRRVKSDKAALRDQYFSDLKDHLDAVPRRVFFAISFEALPEGSKGFVIVIESEPTIVSKIRQLHMKQEVDDNHYDNIIFENKHLVTEIVHALGARVLDPPGVIKPRERFATTPLIETSFVDSMPDEVAVCIREANRCFGSESFLACSVMIRKSIEVAVTKKLFQEGRHDLVFDVEGHEIGLGKKLDLLPQVASRTGRHLDQIKLVKWLGDVSAHDPRTQITPADLQAVAPLVRTFLADLQLKR